jgi:hypothetical protein
MKKDEKVRELWTLNRKSSPIASSHIYLWRVSLRRSSGKGPEARLNSQSCVAGSTDNVVLADKRETGGKRWPPDLGPESDTNEKWNA